MTLAVAEALNPNKPNRIKELKKPFFLEHWFEHGDLERELNLSQSQTPESFTKIDSTVSGHDWSVPELLHYKVRFSRFKKPD